MAYWLDDGFDTWPEVIRAGSAATGLYTRCGSWIARNLTDGLIPSEVAAMYGTREWATKLVEVGLWVIDGDGFRDTRYLPMNPNAETVRKRRADAAERQRRMRARRDTKPARESRVTHGGSHGSPALPPPSTKEGRGVDPSDPPANPDWRRMPAYGQAEPTPETPARAAARAAAASARKTRTDSRSALTELRLVTEEPA